MRRLPHREACDMQNRLYYGDNLDVLRQHIADESVDLVYLDPPFKSEQNYNVLFEEQNGSRSAAQIKAFEDTWRWDEAAAMAYEEVVESGGSASRAMQAFRTLVGGSNMLAYLSMMAPRLLELRRVLKATGSIYLHCDPTASHYLKVLMDAVFDPRNFRGEIIWKCTSAHSNARRLGKVHQTILFYSKCDHFAWNPIYMPYEQAYIDTYYRYKDEDGRRFMSSDLVGHRGVNPEYEWRGIVRPWRYPKHRLDELDAQGRIFWTRNKFPRYKRYLDDMPGMPAQSVWTDVLPVVSWSSERLGYPTQKPEALLERVVQASSNEDQIVLDPFCGCGTAIAVAQKLKRRWIGIDITHLAITLIKHRLRDAFENDIEFEVIGEPVSLPDAETLAAEDPWQFQWWALGLVGARPIEQKRGSDQGIDGRLYFHDEPQGGKTKQVVFSVKSGKPGVAHVRDLRGVIEREEAAIGVLITMKEATKEMRKEAASAGFYHSSWGAGATTKHPRVQLVTIEQLLSGKAIDMPPSRDLRTFKKAPKAKQNPGSGTKNLFLF
jgi:DNA modification methylase